ncbi:MAG: lycopene cyclase family protein, partial [Balneolaceae bacterium]
MGKMNRYDIIIAGAGASGLSLLWYLLKSDSIQQKQILLIDRELTPNDSKTWCFWDDGSIKMPELIAHTWKTLRVDILSESYISKLNKYSYHCIRSIDFTTRILELADRSPNVTLLESDIIDFKSDRDLGVIQTASGDFQAPYIFQSVIKPKETTSDISMIQHFLGWEIELSAELFDPATALLMDFNVDQTHGFSFMYLLPYSRKQALIEYTLFSNGLLSDAQYEEALQHYLTHTLNLKSSDYQVRRKEKGAIPMEDRRYQLT